MHTHTPTRKYLDMLQMSPCTLTWWELPMIQSVRYSTSLLRNFISCRNVSSSRRLIICTTKWMMTTKWTMTTEWTLTPKWTMTIKWTMTTKWTMTIMSIHPVYHCHSCKNSYAGTVDDNFHETTLCGKFILSLSSFDSSSPPFNCHS